MAALFVTGLVLAPWMLERRLEWDIAIPRDLGSRSTWATLHGFASFVAVAIVGALVPVHMRSGWRQGRHLRSGIGVLSLMLVLALTGCGIYYLASERPAIWTSIAHTVVGLFAAILLIAHYVIAKRAQAADARARGTAARRSAP